MKRHRVALVFALVAGFSLQTFAQSVRIEHGVATRKKFGFYWETRLEPETPLDFGSFSSAATSSTTEPEISSRSGSHPACVFRS